MPQGLVFLRKLWFSAEGSFARLRRRHADRDLVSGRSAGRTEGNPDPHLGAGRLAPADGARQSPRLRISIRCNLPRTGVGAAIIMPAANAQAMNEHLTEISARVMPGAHAVMLCDQAGWHQTGGKLQLPSNITLLPLPAYSPELNPMENVWQYLRSNKLCALVWNSYEAIIDACRNAWNFLINDPGRITSIGHREWACVNP